ncbi:MAG: tetratricopeptide repeat protein [Deltaproteobacteria bacterium]|nr:MAG: tetratricopeptide repeat protein [Deltaproteobacteria bacterium]
MNNMNSATPLAARANVCAALALTAFLVPAAALADARSDAKRHFREGMSLIAAGQLERGIAELKQAYAIKPHPDVLYDIAKAYVDLGNISEALNYFRQYVATDPADKEQVLSVMQRLRAAIAPAAPPPQPPPQNIDVQKLLAQLQALIDQQRGHQQPPSAPAPAARPAVARKAEPARAEPEEDMFEAETISAKTRATAREIAAELSAHESSAEDIFEEQVVTASARSSSETKSPASLTVITGDEIRMSGAATVPEILRRVPGIDIAEMNPSDTNVSIRGFNRRLANKVLVLVDGRSVYQDFLGGTFWPLIDVNIQDIDRIEVIRGPGSALYGANAFSGVVNIITRTGDEIAGARAVVQAGDHRTFQGAITTGGKTGKLTYKTSFAYERADKWTRDFTDGRVDLSSQFPQPDRSREIQRGEVAASYDFGKTQVSGGGGFDNVAMQVVPLGALRTFGATGQSGFVRAEVGSGPTKVKAFWNALRLTTGPEYWPDGILSLKSSVRSDVVDLTTTTGFDFKAYGTHHLNIGAGYRFKSLQWGYLASRADGSAYQEHHFNVFLQEEWEITRKLSLVLSYRMDRNPLLAQQSVTAGGLVHSPRGTVLYEVKPDQVLRFTLGTAFRAPTFLESYVDLFAPIPDQPAMGVRFQGSTTLRPEQMLQAELGYRGRFGTFQPDVVIYAERVQNLITDGALRLPANPSEAVDPVTGQYVAGYTGFENEPGSYFGVGAEAGGKWSPADGVDLGLNYSYERMFACSATSNGGCTDSISAANQVSATLANTARHKLNLMATWRTKANFDLGLGVHFVSAATWFEKSFDVNSQGGVTFTPYAVPAHTMVNGRVGYRWIKDKLETGVAFYNLLGDEQREHPFGNQIGRRVLFTASGAF